jgi:homocysteine S-methyltransferase
MINKIKLLDGSMSFPMEQLGYNLKNKLWTGMALISDPDIIKNIHKGYINAGADYISTSTYQVSYDRLKNMGYQSSEN